MFFIGPSHRISHRRFQNSLQNKKTAFNWRKISSKWKVSKTYYLSLNPYPGAIFVKKILFSFKNCQGKFDFKFFWYIYKFCSKKSLKKIVDFFIFFSNSNCQLRAQYWIVIFPAEITVNCQNRLQSNGLQYFQTI